MLYLALVQPCLEYCVQCWASQHEKDIKVLEWTHWRTMKLIEGMSYEGRLRTLVLSSLEKTKLRASGSLQLPEKRRWGLTC